MLKLLSIAAVMRELILMENQFFKVTLWKKMLAQLVKQNRLGRLIREKGYVLFTNLHIVPILYLC